VSQVLRLPSGEHAGFAISAHRGKGQLSTVDFGTFPGCARQLSRAQRVVGLGVVLVAWCGLALGSGSSTFSVGRVALARVLRHVAGPRPGPQLGEVSPSDKSSLSVSWGFSLEFLFENALSEEMFLPTMFSIRVH
jgi:hypothetical protein